jgi:hypothetical protein
VFPVDANFFMPLPLSLFVTSLVHFSSLINAWDYVT